MLKSMLFDAPSGSGSWVETIGGSSSDYGKSVAVASDGSVYVCGYTYSAGAGAGRSGDLFLAKFNSSGVIQWQKTLGGSDWEYGGFVAVAPDGSVYVCGQANSSPSSNSSDLFLAKFNSSGVIQWQKT
ncbi:SBBP repeat-containing protein, partial [Desulfovibrio piger]|uniref:SBBP repeat-containing protein n=1 Tax=Desulfovibrio piger TaxID=901 RepID=UPI0026E9EF60